MNVERNVLNRYSEGAKERQEALCCPVDYDSSLLEMLPKEIVEKDYGCGDPSRYVKTGDTVLDLGSGSGKICYMAAQLVGEKGKVIGIDMNDHMLALARKYQAEMAEKLGNDRVQFLKGYIQDLALNLEATENYLQSQPIKTASDLSKLNDIQGQQKREAPLIADNSVDLVISNCVLNLVHDAQKQQLIGEIFRVLKPGGRVAISDIVSDEAIPQHLKDDAELWSGCISGAFVEDEFAQIFKQVGFSSIKYDKWDAEPWQVVEGIEFRSVTITATKGHGKECIDRGHAVIYKGPYDSVRDEEDHLFIRGQRMAVCQRTYEYLTTGPLKDDFIGIAPKVLAEPQHMCAPAGTLRTAQETKGGKMQGGSGSSCC